MFFFTNDWDQDVILTQSLLLWQLMLMTLPDVKHVNLI